MDTDPPMDTAFHDGVRRPAAETRPFCDRSDWLARHVLPCEPALQAWLQQCRIDAPQIDDIIRETYAVLAALDGVEHIASPREHVFQAAHSVMRRRLRIGDRAAHAAMAESSIEPQLSPRHLRDLIAELPPACREAFSLRTTEGLSQRDIAIRMAIGESRVEGHIARALRFLMSAVSAG